MPSNPPLPSNLGPSARGSGNPRPTEVEPIQSPPPPPCCVLTTWREGDKTCERRPISTASELQTEVASLLGHGRSVSSTATGAFIASAAQEDRGDMTCAARPLITLYGLQAPFLSVLFGSPLGIDPAFVEAHVARRSYRPRGTRRGRREGAARYAHWDYPELVTGHWQAAARGTSRLGSGHSMTSSRGPEGGDDLAGLPVVRPVSDTDKELAAVFCRASLWASQGVDVLFLDRPCWEDQKGPLRKARRAWGKLTGVTAPAKQERQDPEDGVRKGCRAIRPGRGSEEPSLETTLHDNLAGADRGGGLVHVLQEAAHEHWLDLFEVLTPRQGAVVPDGIPLEWRIMQSLESNTDMAKRLARRQVSWGAVEEATVTPGDWADLTQRLRSCWDMCATMTAAGGVRTRRDSTARAARHRTAADAPPPPPPPSASENQRSLDRVTYLGGVLLPFSVVSGVLSMNEDFEPGRPLFWVFWVATIPMALLTVLVIYADNLRQVEVWAEVPVAVGSSGAGGAAPAGGGCGEKVSGTKETGTRPGPVSGGASKYLRRPSGAVTYSAGGDVVVDLGTPAPQFQRFSVELPALFGETRRADEDEDEDEYEGDDDGDDGQVQGQVQGGTSGDGDAAGQVGIAGVSPVDRHGHAWKKKQLGWGGAAMCILRGRKPLRVSDGLPAAAR